METRLRLRQRLLRIDDLCTVPAAPSSAGAPPSPTFRSNQFHSSVEKCEQQPQQELDDDDDEDDEGSGEDIDDEESNGDEDNDADTEIDANAEPTKASNPGRKCPVASVVKLVFSRSDPLGRSPTVCFDYPPSLGVHRDYSGLLVTTVDAQKLSLLYRTCWERNCVKNAFAAAGLSRTRKKWTAWHLAWAKPVPKTQFQRFRGEHDQVFNHFPDPWVIGRKDRLMKTLTNCRRRFGASYDFFPEGFSLPDQIDAFRRALERNESFMAATFPSSVTNNNSDDATRRKSRTPRGDGPLWIMKPPASACGRGIRILTHRDAWRVCENSRKVSKKSKSGKKARIVQKYVAEPLLLGDGARYKFDLRLYVVVTSIDPLRIYLFQEGIARFCTAPYSLKDPRNRFAHLTNYAINKSNGGFVENADAQIADAGSKWSLSALIRTLQSQQLLGDPETLMRDIRAVICKTVIAAEAHLTPLLHQFAGQSSCFELFGFDMMLDAKLRPWLIEVNVSPSLMGGSPLDRRVKGLLLSDTFHLVGLKVPITSVPSDCIPTELNSARSVLLSSSISSMPSMSSPSSTSSSRSLRRSKTLRPNRQLHEIVQDPTIESFETAHLSLFTASDWDIVRTMDDELDRRGHFDRIFPASSTSLQAAAAETASYSRFFTCQRYSNSLCAKWSQTPRDVRRCLTRQQSATSSPCLRKLIPTK
ncbi:Tubulin polyglutamylase ttll4 [Phytophthora boehmeriae]|uniref:Tubulin--tyrosine ligase-like protein 5 n=1 Tax=Phytophthora boehmeriae TaxID=109152 RepID=A0A8T1WV51_9STRA|nr:Tubulin polyglutamylase ttll4 [Phytophthora boehmeriae]